MADVTISNLSPLTPSTGLYLPVTDGSNTGKVTMGEVCGVMTSNQITNALGYTPYNSSNPAGYITSSSLPSVNQLIRAWGTFSGTNAAGTNCTVLSNYNINRIYKEGTGKYIVYFQNALPSKNYAISGTAAKHAPIDDGNVYLQAGGINGGSTNGNTTTNFYIRIVSGSSNLVDTGYISFIIVGG